MAFEPSNEIVIYCKGGKEIMIPVAHPKKDAYFNELINMGFLYKDLRCAFKDAIEYHILSQGGTYISPAIFSDAVRRVGALPLWDVSLFKKYPFRYE